MELRKVESRKGGPGRVRIVGSISCDGEPGRTEELWYEVDEEFGSSLSSSGNPWMLSLLPLASLLGEPLRIRLPVDRLLRRNAREIMAIWASWYPQFRNVDVSAAHLTGPDPRLGGERTAGFFSGGVDSFYAILGSGGNGGSSLPIDELLCVHGFDIPLANQEEFRKHVESLGRTAAALGKPLVSVATNWRETRMREVPWAAVAHGSALAAVGLILECRYRLLVIGSAADYSHLEPNGSHPLLDPLFSTFGTHFIHEGATANRCQKLEALSRFDLVKTGLHVCWRNRSDRNCGECEKCLRNMAILEILGVLKDYEAFGGRELDLDRLGRVYHDEIWHWHVYGGIRDLAVRRGRFDVAVAIDRSFKRTVAVRRALAFSAWLGRRRLLWRGGRRLKRWTLARAVT